MPGPEAWQAFGGVLAVVIFLGGAVLALRRLGVLPGAAPAPAARKEADPDRVAAVEKGLAELRLHVAENYVRRDDYIPNESRVIGLLEAHSAMLARLEERIGAIK